MDIHDAILTPKELTHLFVDGEISEIERTALFRCLSEEVELQDYLAEVIRGEKIMEQYRASVAVPAALSSEIMANAFKDAPVSALPPATAAVSWNLRYGLVASVLAAILAGGIGLRDSSPVQMTVPVSATIALSQHSEYSSADYTTGADRKNINIIPHAQSSAINKPTVSEAAGSNYQKTYNKQGQTPEQLVIPQAYAEETIAAPIKHADFASPDHFTPDIAQTNNAPDVLTYSRNRNYFDVVPKDIAVTVGGFGADGSLGSPSRLAAMYIINQEFAFGFQYTARSYSAVMPINGGNEANPSASGIEAVAQYVENSDILPLGIKPVANFAAGYSRLGPTAFFFAGISADAFDIVSLQTGIEGNAVFYDYRGSKMTAGGLRFAVNAGVKF